MMPVMRIYGRAARGAGFPATVIMMSCAMGGSPTGDEPERAAALSIQPANIVWAANRTAAPIQGTIATVSRDLAMRGNLTSIVLRVQ